MMLLEQQLLCEERGAKRRTSAYSSFATRFASLAANTVLTSPSLSRLSSSSYIPLWGTCLGLETISSIVAPGGEDAVLSDFDAEQLSLPLKFTEQADESRLYGEVRGRVPFRA